MRAGSKAWRAMISYDADQLRPLAARLVDRLEDGRDVELVLRAAAGSARAPRSSPGARARSRAPGDRCRPPPPTCPRCFSRSAPRRTSSETFSRRVVGDSCSWRCRLSASSRPLASASGTADRARRSACTLPGLSCEDDVFRRRSPLGVAQHLFPHAARCGSGSPRARRGSVTSSRLLRRRVDEIAPALGARVEPLQRDQRRRVLGLDALRAAEVFDRAFRLSPASRRTRRRRRAAARARAPAAASPCPSRTAPSRTAPPAAASCRGCWPGSPAPRAPPATPGSRRPRACTLPTPGRCCRAGLPACRSAAAGRRACRSSSRARA